VDGGGAVGAGLADELACGIVLVDFGGFVGVDFAG